MKVLRLEIGLRRWSKQNSLDELKTYDNDEGR